MSCAAIVINYFTRSLTEALVKSLNRESMITRIIIVDNSRELKADSIKEFSCKPIEVLTNSKNSGYGAAANQGMKIAKEDWMLVVNPDVRFFPGCLESLLNAAMQYKAPLVGPRFYLDEEKRFRIPPATGSCLWMDSALKCAARFQLDADILSFYWNIRHDRFWSADAPFIEPFLSGAALLIEKAWIQKTGGDIFDERFFLYFEDTDLCIRIRERNGYCLCVPQAEAVHFYDQSPSPEISKAQLMGDARSAFFSKYYENLNMSEIMSDCLSPEYTDSGAFSRSPSFDRKKRVSIPEESYFEIAVDSRFIPFVQARSGHAAFSIPSQVWNRLRAGTYFGRFRGSISGVSEVFKWEKS